MTTKIFEKLSYAFKNSDLAEQAITHKSFHNENLAVSKGHNERMEFLGDAVLDLSLTVEIYNRFPELAEGELSKIRASLVNEVALAEIAREFDFEKLILLGKGEKLTGGASKPRLLASSLEALFGAIFLDSDFATADQVIKGIFLKKLDQLDLSIHFKDDYKTRLQEKLQSKQKLTPVYSVEREDGPDHDKIFHVNLKINDQVVSTGSGRSKKQAEQDAARAALESLNK